MNVSSVRRTRRLTFEISFLSGSDPSLSVLTVSVYSTGTYSSVRNLPGGWSMTLTKEQRAEKLKKTKEALKELWDEANPPDPPKKSGKQKRRERQEKRERT